VPDAVASPERIHTDIDTEVLTTVLDTVYEHAIASAIADCSFCVTVADPSKPDCPLIAVSDAFARITGYRKEHILGRNCRFLNTDCCIDPQDLMRLRLAEQSGTRTTVLLPNRKKNGMLFTNLLDVCGFKVAKDLDTNKDIWYLVGVQADVTGLMDDEMPEDHLCMLHEVATNIKTKLAHDLQKMVLDAASKTDTGQTRRIKVLQEPDWLGDIRTSDERKKASSTAGTELAGRSPMNLAGAAGMTALAGAGAFLCLGLSKRSTTL